MTALRPEFDAWLASQAVAAGARLVASTVVRGLLREPDGRVVGVSTDRPDGDLTARVVIACDGVNSFCAKEAGLYPDGNDAGHFTLGAKEVLALPKDVVDDRFGVRDRDGVDIEILGGTSGIPGGGFVYTNLDTVAVGVVLSLPALAASGTRPEAVIAGLKAHPAIAPLVEGGDLKEYSAHLIPEAGYDAIPKLGCDGMLVAGDAAGLCLAAGIYLEGVNFAIGSGAMAAEAAADALRRGDTSAEPLVGNYRRRLEAGFVLADHRKLRRAPHLVLGERAQLRYPQVLCNLLEGMFTVTNPAPKQGGLKLARRELRRAGVRLRDLARDGYDALRSYG